MMRGLLALLVLVLGLGPGLHAQEAADPAPAILIADSVFISNNNTLVAEGNVEALQGDIRLRASKITYDQSTGQMQITGPITIQQGENQTILADTATLDDSLQSLCHVVPDLR